MRDDLFLERLEECKTTYKLNLAYCNIEELPKQLVTTVNKYNPHLLELDLTSNQLSCLPSDLHDLRYLRTLRVKYNKLPEIPEVCFRLERCVVLDLAGNQIETIPDAITHLHALQELDVSGNRISSLTGRLDQLVHLSVLSLEDNLLKALPEAIGLCTSLIKFKCSTNLLRALPATMGNLKKAQRLDFANNHILKVPPVIGHLKALKELNLRYNPLESTYQRAADEGLSKFLAFLKKEEAREDAEARERLRPIGTQAGSFTEYRCKAFQPIAQASKTAAVADSAAAIAEDALGGGPADEVDHRPLTRLGATLCKHHDTFYLFGGSVVRDGGRKSMELYVLSTDTMAWRRQVTTGDGRPVARSDHCAVIDPDTERLVIFGGRSQDKKRLNDVWALDLKSLRWFRQNCSGAAPRPRDKASAVFCQGHMVVFGGHTTGKRLNDLCVLDLTSFSWSSWTSVMGQPSPRESAALCVGHGNMLFLHGGASNFGLDDLWVYDQKLQAWIEVAAEGARPPARRGHSLYMHDGHLHLFGGIDELGAPSTAMFRVAIEYGLNLSTVRLRWEELLSERIFNPNRMVAFDQANVLSDGRARSVGQIMCFQLGSRSLGAVATEDLDRGNVFFDVFAIADLASLAVRAQAAVAAAPPHGKRLRVEHTVNQIAKMPRRFSINSPSEKRLAAYLRDFAVVFTELYRHRRPLYLMPQNECCVQKCVCTTIRPTKLPFLETYDMAGAVSFVTNAIAYEPLENPLHPPEHLLSPQSVLSFQAGDSFDMASLLVSLLLGCGYDAYVVGGYAPADIVQNDQSSQICPLLEAEFASGDLQKAEAAAGTSLNGVKAGPKYEVKREVEFASEFERSLQVSADDAATKEAASASAAAAQAASDKRERDLDSLRIAREPGQRFMHAWVLVKAGARGVQADVFVEVTSGRQYAPAASPYTGIEWVWSHENFWIAMDLPEPHSDARLHPARALFDFWDANRWEAMLPRPRPPPPADVFPAAGSDGGEAAGDGDGEKPPFAPGPATLSGMAMSRQKSVTVRGDVDTAAATLRDSDGGPEASTSADLEALIEMPDSWVPRLAVTRDMLDMRVPKGSKKTVYRFSEHELFALFGETSKFDGSLERLTVFTDEEHQVKLEDREFYARRKDKLREKRRYYDASGSLQSFVEHYDCGSAYGIRSLWQFFSVNDEGESVLTRQVGEYYAAARLDFLVRKEEIIGVKAIETYSDRPDNLIYRSATYGPMPPGNDAVDKPQPLVKMTEKFRRNSEVPAQEDVQRRVFYLAQASIRIDYHIPEDSLTNSYRIYTKQGRSHVVQSDPLLTPVDTIAQLEQFQQLVAAEKECMTCIRQNEWETKEFGKVRKLLNEAVSLVTPYYDIARINADESDDEEAEAPEATYDYLSPFLPNISGTRGLTRNEALHVREVCLRALKERLIERANIIQARHDEEAAAIAKRRTNFQRDRDQLAKEAEAEYEEACERAAFKLQILEKRLKHHEEQAIRKYYELDHQLRKDPRLSALVQPPTN